MSMPAASSRSPVRLLVQSFLRSLETRKVNRTGVRYQGEDYFDPALAPLFGLTVQVFLNDGRLNVFHHAKHVCAARRSAVVIEGEARGTVADQVKALGRYARRANR